MVAQIIQLRDYQNPKDLARMYSEQSLEQQALEMMAIALSGEPGMVGMEPVIHIPYGGQGIDGMFVAPEDDSA